MKKTRYVQSLLSLLMIIALLSPVSALAAGGDGKKHFKEGMRHENAEEWDRAAEEFALAVVDDPKNPEYRLHYRRSLFNASQMFMQKGRSLAAQKDYAGAYIAFRKAYGYDPVNELAKAEMERMLRFQEGLQNGDLITDADGTVRLVKTSAKADDVVAPDDFTVPQKLEKLRDVPFPGGVDLQFLIKELAQDLDLNVLFDADTFRQPQKIQIELKNVTAAKALDYIFLQQGLFFQKVGPRTILVANQNRRQNFQQLVLRTFYLSNANPKDVAKVVQTAIPAQPGRTPTIPLIDEATNSITVRDTSENIKIIADLITALDKDRAEVVMDVAIYEVTKTDLLQLGNQIGSSTSLANLGGVTSSVVTADNNKFLNAAGALLPVASGVGFIIPAVNLVALQDKQNTKLIASTQIHAFNNEDSSARIGQRVPVQTAQFQTGGTNNNGGVVSNVINYEQVGLTLKFKPIVFPNQDVQVAMEIESKDVTGAASLTPIFTERTIKGTARVQNNKTLLLASVAQNVESNGRTGLPLLGLIPIIGRLFTAPKRDNRQTDIVIAITPRVIRAPSILPEDEIERPTGSLAVPTSGSLEAMLINDERDEQIALARRTKTTNMANVQLPDQQVEKLPEYVKSGASAQNTENKTIENIETPVENVKQTTNIATSLKPIETTNVKTLNLNPTSTGNKTLEIKEISSPGNDILKAEPEANTDAVTPKPIANLSMLNAPKEMKRGEKTKIAVMVSSPTAFRSAVLGLKYDATKMSVKSVSFGEVFGKEFSQTDAAPFLNQGGKTYVSFSTTKDTADNSSGVLAYIEIEALADGVPNIAFDQDVLNFLTSDGKNFAVKY